MAFSITAFLQRLRAAPRGERELWLAGLAIAFGLFLLPCFIYLAGSITLGPYEGGGLGDYVLDFLRGLVRPHLAYWIIVIGPYLLITLARGLWLLRKRMRAVPSPPPAPPAPGAHPARRN